MDIKDNKDEINENSSTEINEVDDLIKRIEGFKKEVAEHRKKLTKDESFKIVDNDHQYKLLLDKSAFSIEDDMELDLSHYPFGHTLRMAKKENRVEDPEYPAIDFDKISNKEYRKVYLKAFEEQQDTTETIKIGNIDENNKREIAKKIIAQTHKDTEEYIYENIINKIGIVILTVAVMFLINQGVDAGYIAEGNRLLVGLIFAGIFGFFAHQLKDANPAFSVLFVIATATILYYTSYLAYRDYDLIPQFLAFTIKILITALTLFFAVYHNRQILAIAAIFGAYSTPFFVKANEDYEVFFIYLFVINLLIMGIAYIKNWHIINNVVFVCTIVFFESWMGFTERKSEDIFTGGVIFSSLFFLQFLAMTIMRSLRPYIAEGDVRLTGLDYMLFFANAILYAISIFNWLSQMNLVKDYFGLFGLALGVFHALLVVFLRPHPRHDVSLINYSLFIALGLITFSPTIQVASSLQLNLFWGLEAAVLLWIAYKSRIQLFADASAIVFSLSLTMLFVVWSQVYYFNSNIDVVAFFNDAVYASFFTVIGIGVSIAILLQKGKSNMILTFTTETYTGILGGLLIVIVYITGAIELNYHPFTNKDLTRLIIGIYNGIFVMLFWLWADRNSVSKMQTYAEYLMIAMVASYLLYGHSSSIELRNRFLEGDPATPLSHFMTHYINVAIALVGMYLLLVSVYKKSAEGNSEFATILWIASIIAIFHLSAELDHLVVLTNYNATTDSPEIIDELLEDTHRLLYPILWGLISFLMMFAGMRYKIQALRMMSLVLFGAILGKFFIFDFWRINVFSRIIASIFIGGLLLFISYLYNQLRIMVLEGELDTEAIKAILKGKQIKVNPAQETEAEREQRFHARDIQKEQAYTEEDKTEESNDESHKPSPPKIDE
jgi:uncharacterized membrane protein